MKPHNFNSKQSAKCMAVTGWPKWAGDRGPEVLIERLGRLAVQDNTGDHWPLSGHETACLIREWRRMWLEKRGMFIEPTGIINKAGKGVVVEYLATGFDDKRMAYAITYDLAQEAAILAIA